MIIGKHYEIVFYRMGIKEDQVQVRRVLRDTIKLLCKNGLKYSKEFSIEGLLGITVDSQEIFLVNINETFSQPDTSNEVNQQHAQEEPPSLSGYSATSHRSSVTYSSYHRNTFGRRTMGCSYSGLRKMRQQGVQRRRNRPPKVWLTNVSGTENEAMNNDTTPKNSGIENAATSTFITSNRTYMSSTGSREESQSETSGEEALQRLADCVGRINNDSLSVDGSNTKETLSTQGSQYDATVKEEVMSDPETIICNDFELAQNKSTCNENEEISSNEESLIATYSNVPSKKIKTEKNQSFGFDTKSTDNEEGASMSWFSPPEGTGRPVFPMFSAEQPNHTTVTRGPVISPLCVASPRITASPMNLKVPHTLFIVNNAHVQQELYSQQLSYKPVTGENSSVSDIKIHEGLQELPVILLYPHIYTYHS